MANIEIDASNVPTLMKCSGNYRFLGLPKEDLSDAQKEAAVAFKVLVNVLKGESPRKGLEEFEVDQEMIDFAHKTAAKIMEDEPDELRFEDHDFMDFFTDLGGNQYSCHKLHVRPNIWYIDKNDIMVIVDYKYGRKVEEVVENWRLISQALVTAYEYSDGETPVPDCKVVIAQPRASHHLGFYRSWDIRDYELLEKYRPVIDDLFQKLHKAELKDRSGPHCVHCPGFSKCQVANDSAMNMLEVVKTVNKSDLELTNDQKATQLELIDEIFTFLKNKKTALENDLTETISKGGKVSGWGLKEGKGSYAWDGSEEDIRAGLKLMSGKDPVVEKLLSPAQVSETFGVPRKLVNKFTKRIPGKTKLVKMNAEEEAAQLFGKENKPVK